MRGMAKEMKMDEKSMKTIIKEDLKMSLYKIRSTSCLLIRKKKRRERAQLLLNQLKGNMKVGKIIFSDEELFIIEAKFNSQNGRLLATQSEDIPDNLRTGYRVQKPASVMVWAAISEH